MFVHIAVALFSCSVVTGLVAGSRRMIDKPVSQSTGIVHACFGLTGLFMLVVQGLTDGFTGALKLVIGLLCLTALLGVRMFMLQLSGQPVPLFLVMFHSMVSMSGVAVLVVTTYKLLSF